MQCPTAERLDEFARTGATLGEGIAGLYRDGEQLVGPEAITEPLEIYAVQSTLADWWTPWTSLRATSGTSWLTLRQIGVDLHLRTGIYDPAWPQLRSAMHNIEFVDHDVRWTEDEKLAVVGAVSLLTEQERGVVEDVRFGRASVDEREGRAGVYSPSPPREVFIYDAVFRHCARGVDGPIANLVPQGAKIVVHELGHAFARARREQFRATREARRPRVRDVELPRGFCDGVRELTPVSRAEHIAAMLAKNAAYLEARAEERIRLEREREERRIAREQQRAAAQEESDAIERELPRLQARREGLYKQLKRASLADGGAASIQTFLTGLDDVDQREAWLLRRELELREILRAPELDPPPVVETSPALDPGAPHDDDLAFLAAQTGDDRTDGYWRMVVRSWCGVDDPRLEACPTLSSDREGERGGVHAAYAQVPGAGAGPTEYGATHIVESFAEAFALFHVDPESLRAVAPEVWKWFTDGGHLRAHAAATEPRCLDEPDDPPEAGDE